MPYYHMPFKHTDEPASVGGLLYFFVSPFKVAPWLRSAYPLDPDPEQHAKWYEWTEDPVPESKGGLADRAREYLSHIRTRVPE